MKIFIIDDDFLSIFLTEHLLMLDNPSHEIMTFILGAEALFTLQKENEESFPDIIFLDLNMPLMSGWDFLDAIAPLGPVIIKKCSIYILTSSLDLSDLKRSKEYELVSGLLHKPLSSDDIKRVCSSTKSSS